MCLTLTFEKPTLLLNKERALQNIETMAKKAEKSGVRFRPHFKTHQSAEIGEWFRQQGVTAITVSSVDMAAYFAKNGWEDITIAFPVNLLQIQQINALAEQIQLSLLLESQEAVLFLDKNLTAPVDIWLKIDVGYHRTGIASDNADAVLELAKELEKTDRLRFKGLLTHAGHSYYAHSVEEIKEIHRTSVSLLTKLRTFLLENGISSVQLSIGDTPTCSVVNDFLGVDEIRPGSFVFYDLSQWEIGACQEEDIAVAVACPVVATHPERTELVIYGGGIHFSKEYFIRKDGTKIFGFIAPRTTDGWGPLIEDCYISSLSQEHGIVKVSAAFLENVNLGDMLLILPVHCCLTANLMRQYTTTNGEIIDHWQLSPDQ
jgi:D-serine deaminase-like pyridoxal phosphate-dependent protein